MIVDDKLTQLYDKKREIFHLVVMKLLFIIKQARSDCKALLSFLTKSVSKSDKGDGGDLRTTLIWLKSTIDNVRLIYATNLTNIFTWIDAVYDIHSDMRRHMGGSMSMGIGMKHIRLSTQKNKHKMFHKCRDGRCK